MNTVVFPEWLRRAFCDLAVRRVKETTSERLSRTTYAVREDVGDAHRDPSRILVKGADES